MSIKLGEKSTSHLPLLPPGTSEVDLKPIASWGRTSAIVFILPFVGHLSRGMGLAYTTSLPFLLILLWFLPYIFICKSSLVGSNLFHKLLLCNSCDFSVPGKGGELRDFLFHNLSQSSINLHSISIDFSSGYVIYI